MIHAFESAYSTFCYLAGTVGFVCICLWAWWSDN